MNVAIQEIYCCKPSVYWVASVPDTEENRALLTRMQAKEPIFGLMPEERRLWDTFKVIRRRTEDHWPMDESEYDYVLRYVVC